MTFIARYKYLFIFLTVALAVFIFVRFNIWSKTRTDFQRSFLCQGLQRIQAYGTVREELPFPKFTASTMSGREVGHTTPPGKFHIHIIGNIFESECLDEECGPEASLVVEKGGHLYVSGDPKSGKTVGLPLFHDMNKTQFVDTLLFVVAPDRRTLAIYRNASPASIPQVLADLKL